MVLLHYVGFVDDFGLLTRIHWDMAHCFAYMPHMPPLRIHWDSGGMPEHQKRNWPLKRDPENLSRNFLARSLYGFFVLILIRVAVVLGCPRKLANG